MDGDGSAFRILDKLFTLPASAQKEQGSAASGETFFAGQMGSPGLLCRAHAMRDQAAQKIGSPRSLILSWDCRLANPVEKHDPQAMIAQ